MTPDDGMSLWIGGGAVAAIAGLVGAWIKARFTRPQPQPFEVEQSRLSTVIDDNTRDHEAIFTRLHIIEKTVARHDGVLERITPQLDRIENKLDRLSEQKHG